MGGVVLTLPGPPPRRTRIGSRLGCSKEGAGSARLVPRPTLPGKQEILAPRLSRNFSSRWVRSVDYALTTTKERSVAHLCAPAQSVGFPRLLRIGWCARPWLLWGARPPAHPPAGCYRVCLRVSLWGRSGLALWCGLGGETWTPTSYLRTSRRRCFPTMPRCPPRWKEDGRTLSAE